MRGEDERWASLDYRVGRGVICRFVRARNGFYKRCTKKGGKSGYPRFKSRHRWRTVEIPDASVSMLQRPGEGGRWWRLRVKGVPAVGFADRNQRLAGALEAGWKLAEVRLVRTVLRTELHAVFNHDDLPEPVEEPSNPVGIDKGVTTRMVLSDGTTVPARTVDHTTVRRRRRALSRATKRSRSYIKKRRALAKVTRRQAEQARDADFRLAHQFVTSYDGIAVEDLNTVGLLRTKRFSKKLSEQRWAAFDRILEHKAAKAGVPYVKVDPSYTTTDCSSCGNRQRIPLQMRVYQCEHCGLRLCRDVNAARNIRDRGFPTKSRCREGLSPDTARVTSYHCKTTRVGTP